MINPRFSYYRSADWANPERAANSPMVSRSVRCNTMISLVSLPKLDVKFHLEEKKSLISPGFAAPVSRALARAADERY